MRLHASTTTVGLGLLIATATMPLTGCWIVAGVGDAEVASGGASATGSGGMVGAGAGATTGPMTGAGGSVSSTGSAATTGTSVTTGSAGAGGWTCSGDIMAYRQAVMADSPSGYWKLDENSGAATANDATTGHHDGTYTKITATTAPGVICNEPAAHFPGTGYIDLGDIFGFTGLAPFSVEVWMNPSYVGADWLGVVTKEWADLPDAPTDREGWVLYIQNSATIGCGIERWAGAAQTQAATSPPATNTYTHVVGVYDGVGLHFWLNGVSVAVGSSGITLTPNSSHLVIGALYGGVGHYFVGDLDEVAIYDYALAKERIQAHYTAATAP